MYSVEYLWTEDELQPFEIENLFPEGTLTFVIISTNIDQTLSNYIRYMDPWIKQYPWNYKQPDCQARVTHTIEYIYGEFQYHEHTLDMELFLALLLNFTKYDHNCYIHVFDSVEIEPVLVLCHDCIPSHLEDVTSGRNKVWLHQDSVIVLNDHIGEKSGENLTKEPKAQGEYLPLQRAVRQAFNGDWLRNDEMTNTVKQHCSIETGLSNVHDICLTLPEPVAKVILRDPMMVANSLVALEGVDDMLPIIYDHGVDVTIPVNGINLGVLLRLASEFEDETGINNRLEHNAVVGGLILAGLQEYYKNKREPKVPETLVQGLRSILQNELLNRGIINAPVETDEELVNLISGKDAILPGTQDDEEEYARKLQDLFEHGYENFEDILEEDEQDDELQDEIFGDDDEGVELSEELKEFRWKYYDLTSNWLAAEEVRPMFEKVKNSMMEANSNFHQDFKGTEFEDFPAFMELDVILEMAQPSAGSNSKANGYNDDSDYQSDNGDTYQGDMAYDDYIRLRKKLQTEKHTIHNKKLLRDDSSDDDWEDVDDDDDDNDDENEISNSDSDEYEDEELGDVYDETPKIELLGEEGADGDKNDDENEIIDTGLDTKLTKKDIERLTKNMKEMKTSEATSLENAFRKVRER